MNDHSHWLAYDMSSVSLSCVNSAFLCFFLSR